MRKKMFCLTFVFVLSLVCTNYTSAGIVYVDATDGEAGNTALAMGEVFTSVDVGTGGSGADGLWRWRAFANGGTIFEAGGSWEADLNTEDCPRLLTSVEVPEGDYEVYVYFWTDDLDQWRIQASLENSSRGDLPLYLAKDPNGEATVAVAEDFEEPVPMLTEGNRTLWQVKLGATGVTTAINVYVDDDPNHLVGGARTWYDGIGYGLVQEPVIEPIDPGTEGLVAAYGLEGDVLDSSGNEFHGTIVGDPNFIDGPIGMAMDFNGDDYVDCGNDESFSVTEYLTVALWVNIRTIPTAWTGAITKGNTAWRISNNGTTTGMHFGFEDGTRGWQAANSATELNAGEWYHVCGVYDINNVGAKIYINGVEDGSNPDTEGITQNTSIVAIGTNSDSTYPEQAWDGFLDEVYIYNRALSEAEVLFLATPPKDPGVEGLVAAYGLDGDVLDASGNGNDGVIINDPNDPNVVNDPGFVDGVAGQALDLDGVDDYIDCGANPLLGMQETNAMTVAGWCSIRACTNAWACIAAKGEYAWRLSNMNLDPSFHFGITWWQSADTYGVNGATAVGFDEWHHVAGSFDGANINLYLDGALDGTAPTTEPIGANEMNVLIGNNPYDLARFWDGLIDEVVIYNRALSDAEIAFLAQ